MNISRIADRLGYLLTAVGLLAVVHVANVLLQYELVQYGVLPRNVSKIWQILTAPFIHGSNYHLVNNVIGLVIFGAIAVLKSKRYFFIASALIIIVSGLLVWIFGRASLHVGASGWIFGLWSLSIATAFFDKRFWNIAIALIVVFFYGGMIYGVLPGDPRISFEFHLAGALSGFLVAMWLHSKKGRRSR
ncbi:rhomboid family intramembrane serine protease [Aurantivibrio plasticivorans]